MGRLYKYVLMVVAAVLSAACASNQMNDVLETREFMFDIFVNPCTKAVGTDNEFAHADDVPPGIWSFTEDGTPYLIDEKLCVENGIWSPVENRIWSNDVEAMDFVAYSPHGRAGYEKEKGVCFTSYELEEDLDLMYSAPLTDMSIDRTQDIIHIGLFKALSFMRFKVVSYVPDHTQVIVKSIIVENIYTSGDFRSLPEASWDNLSEAQDVCFFEGSAEVGENAAFLGEGMYMIPQKTGVSIKLSCDIVTKDSVLSDQYMNEMFIVCCRPGKISTYVIKIDGSLKMTVDKDKE